MEVKILNKPTQPLITISQIALAKILIALNSDHSDKEFMFLGKVYKNKDEFDIMDVYFTPQIATGVSIETDDDEYPEWLNKNFPNIQERKLIRLHGHSHVNMSTTPSGTDEKFIEERITTLSDFFIQLIINNKGNYTLNLFDKKSNLIFENCKMHVLVSISKRQDFLAECTSLKNINLQLPKDFDINDEQHDIKLDGQNIIINKNISINIVTRDIKIKNFFLTIKNSIPTVTNEDLIKSILEELDKNIKEKIAVLSKEITYEDDYYDDYYYPYNSPYTIKKQPTSKNNKKIKGVKKYWI